MCFGALHVKRRAEQSPVHTPASSPLSKQTQLPYCDLLQEEAGKAALSTLCWMRTGGKYRVWVYLVMTHCRDCLPSVNHLQKMPKYRDLWFCLFSHQAGLSQLLLQNDKDVIKLPSTDSLTPAVTCKLGPNRKQPTEKFPEIRLSTEFPLHFTIETSFLTFLYTLDSLTVLQG